MRSLHVVDGECEVDVAAALVVRLGPPLVPCQLELMRAYAVTQEDELPRAVFGPLLPHGDQTERLLVKRERGFEVKYVNLGVRHGELHGKSFLVADYMSLVQSCALGVPQAA